MFGSWGREFEEDPFFSEPFSAHQEHVRQIMRSFSDPFGRDPFRSIADGRGRTHGQRERYDSRMPLRGDQRAMSCSLMPFSSAYGMNSRDPFDMINGMMSDMRNKMFDMQKNFDQAATGSDAHSFTSSSVKTYSKVGDAPAKVFEATNQSCRAPGGIKETRQAVRDSETGLAKMAVGHHIQDRAHIIEKRIDNKTGNAEVHQEFCNLDESDAPTFEDEWSQNVSKFKTFGSKSHLEAPKHRSVHRAEIMPKDGGSGRQKSHHKPTAEGSRKPKVSCGSPQY